MMSRDLHPAPSTALEHCWITGEQSQRDIHATVSEQLKKNFAKSRWRVGSTAVG